MNTEIDENFQAVDNTEPDTTTQASLPGLDILDIVRREVMRAASEGNPPRYIFMRHDIYTLASEAHGVQGVMRWVDPDTDLDCTLRPLYPGEGQNPFILANDIDAANQVIIGSFPRGTFVETPAEYTPDASEYSQDTQDVPLL